LEGSKILGPKTAESIPRIKFSFLGSSGTFGVNSGATSRSRTQTWALADRVARHRMRRGSTWVDHGRPRGTCQSWLHVGLSGEAWATGLRGKNRGDGWIGYISLPSQGLAEQRNQFFLSTGDGRAGSWVCSGDGRRVRGVDSGPREGGECGAGSERANPFLSVVPFPNRWDEVPFPFLSRCPVGYLFSKMLSPLGP